MNIGLLLQGFFGSLVFFRRVFFQRTRLKENSEKTTLAWPNRKQPKTRKRIR